MSDNQIIKKIKNSISKNLGNNFDIVSKHGRKKLLLENCTIDSVYPSIFVIKCSDAKQTGISFSYIDILTKNVCIYPPFSVKKEKGA